MTFHLITIFPHIFDSYLSESILKRAQAKKLIKIKIHDLRDWAPDKRRTIDDKPFGGGPGMIFKIEPIFRCLKKIRKFTKIDIKKQLKNKKAEYSLFQQKNSKIILMDPKGEIFTSAKAKKLSKLKEIILIAGRYEGIDARVDNLIDEKISIGNYILSGGELPALVLIEAVARLAPGVLGNQNSLQEETEASNLEYPQYTRPASFSPIKGINWPAPEVLLSGHHKKIKEWQKGKWLNG